MLFRNRPELAPELLRDALHLELPAYTEVRIEAADLTEVVPAEYRADLVVLLINGKPVLAIIVEVQLSRDDRKRFTWPVYVAGIRARFECPAVVLVVTPADEVARWASAPIALGPGTTLQPLVLGPDAVPVVTDLAAAERDPELAVLSVMAHGRGDDADVAAQIALVASKASERLGEERWLLYFGLIRSALSEAARKAFQMLPQGQRFFDESQQRSFEEGEARGRAAEKAAAVLEFLDARGLPITPAQRERILGTKDLETLTRWVRRAATVTSVDALFE